MENRMNWADRPLWVRIGLFGVPNRKTALIWMKGTLAFVIVAAVAMAVAPFIVLGNSPLAVGMSTLLVLLAVPGMLLSPLWYWLAIQWTDEHDGWSLHGR
jgi:hypothetical protein